MARLTVPALVALIALGATSFADDSARKPRLVLRASPASALPPADVLVTAELVGGGDLEDFYCPEIEWTWADGTRSAHLEDCPPFEPGTRIERRFTSRRVFVGEGQQVVRVALRRGERVVAQSTTSVWLAGGGTPSGW